MILKQQSLGNVRARLERVRRRHLARGVTLFEVLIVIALIALLGGIEVFGLAGLIIAPNIMSVFVAAFRLYEREVRTGGLLGAMPTTSAAPVATAAGPSSAASRPPAQSAT